MDISFGIDIADSYAVMVVRDPRTGEPMKNKKGVAVTMTLASTDSELYQRELNAMVAKESKRNGGKMSIEEARDKNIAILSKCCTAWTGFDNGDKAAECNPKNAEAVFRAWPFLREQADQFMADRANYYRD